MTPVDQRAPFEVPDSFRKACLTLPDELVIVARWDDEKSQDITIQDFLREGESFIPIFSSEAEFDRQIEGSGFEQSGVVIDTELFLSMMRGGEWLILDAGGSSPKEIRLPER